MRGLCKKFQGDVYLTARDEERGKVKIWNPNLRCPCNQYQSLQSICLFTLTFIRPQWHFLRQKASVPSSTCLTSPTRRLSLLSGTSCFRGFHYVYKKTRYDEIFIFDLQRSSSVLVVSQTAKLPVTDWLKASNRSNRCFCIFRTE